MLSNTDTLFAVLSPDQFSNRPTSDFYTVNDIYREVEAEETNWNSWACSDYVLVNAPVFGVQKFYVHTGIMKMRFTEVEGDINFRVLESKIVSDNDEQIAKVVQQLCVKYAIVGVYLAIEETLGGAKVSILV